MLGVEASGVNSDDSDEKDLTASASATLLDTDGKELEVTVKDEKVSLLLTNAIYVSPPCRPLTNGRQRWTHSYTRLRCVNLFYFMS